MTLRFKNWRAVAALVAALTMGSVTHAQDVKSNYVPGTDFSKYHAYKWVEIKDAQHPNQIVDAEIKQAVDAQMASKGFTKTNDDNASLYLGYTIAVDQEKQWNAFAWVVAYASGAWDRQPVQQSVLDPWCWICMIQPPRR
jgi:hypothetical protein